MMPREYESVDHKVLKIVLNTWKDRRVKFEITGCKAFWRIEDQGIGMWIICLKVKSRDIHQLRLELGLKKDENYNPHITILERETMNT